MNVKHIDIAKEFSSALGGRHKKNGPWSGEEFLERLLLPAYGSSDLVVVELDGIVGYTASFFDEAFGGLVRRKGREVLQRVKFSAIRRSDLAGRIQTWMEQAANEGPS